MQWVPDGWVIQGGDSTSLPIAPKGFPDKDPMSFRNKLTVLSASSDLSQAQLTEGTKVSVGSRTGYLRRPPAYQGQVDPTQIFTYQDVSGRWVQIQVPDSLHWGASQIARFAAGVRVINGAGDSHG